MDRIETAFIASRSIGFDLHAHDDAHEFHFFTMGETIFQNGASTFKAGEGMLIYTPPRMPHAARLPAGTREVRFYFLQLWADPESELLLKKLALPMAAPLRLGLPCAARFEEIRRKHDRNDFSSQSAAYLFRSMLCDIGADRTSASRPALFHPAVERVITAMRDRIYGEFTLDDCLHVAKMGKPYLTRIFRQETGMPPMRYYTSMKMETARHLLVASTEPVYSIAQKLGYWDEFHFSRMFKQYTGSSPLTFRKKGLR